MSEIRVEKVNPATRTVTVSVGNVWIDFRKTPGGVRRIACYKPYAQVDDPEARWLPRHLFLGARAKAVGELNRMRAAESHLPLGRKG